MTNYTPKFSFFEDHLKEMLKDPDFKKGFDALTPQYELKRAIIRKRLAKGMTQKDLARKMHTRQSAISRLESGYYNPTFSFLQRVAKALGSTLTISL
jgi:ribosome-binding protein aMBF1 (putative translation factor)